MAGRGGGAYINGRYVPNAGKAKGKGGGGGGRGEGGRATGWALGGDEARFERKPGDEEVTLERKFDIDILQAGESRVGYLFNLKPTHHYDEGGRKLSGVILYFLQRDSNTFRCSFLYRPFFFLQIGGREKLDSMRDILNQRFATEGVFAEIVEKEDLSMEDHIIGRTRKMIKLSFENVDGLNKARKDLAQEMKRQTKKDGSAFEAEDKGAMNLIEGIFEHDVPYINRVCIDNKINCGKWYTVSRNQLATSIDNIWDTQCTVVAKDDLLAKPGLRIFAWDIECTKEPLKFPDSAHDRITLISVMVDGIGFLIVNRSEVSEDIEPLEYTPKPEYEGTFDTFNEPDEASLLRRFFALIRETNPHVSVTFNGDFFDMPFVMNRARAYNMDWKEEVGLDKQDGDFYAGKWMVHLDCFCWVQRDSYLPCGARGLKAVTRYKLKYDPVELDPEDMTPFAKERPQELAAYSVSDAVATYYLYQKYIHDFIFALCSIIPYGPDDVLRKGSGTLCESLLMNQAYWANVLFPNKHVDDPLEFHERTNRLIEQSTYEGARVECMRVGVYRADIKETFQLEPSAFQVLLNDLKGTVDFFLTVEEKVKLEDVENYDEVLADVEKTLRDLCDPTKVAEQIGRRALRNESPSKKVSQEDLYNLKPIEYEVVEGSGGVKSGGKKVKRVTERVIKEDYPMIYHLDVGAMYPNIILSNRLQPSAIVSKEFCAACSYNDPENNCKRPMEWKWRGDLYMATRADVKSIVNGLENEKKRYNSKDRDSGEMKRVKWSELSEKEQVAEITKAVRVFSQKAYSRLKSSVYEERKDVVCQRENPFYVNTVLNFRDRRYVFKRKTKEWTKAFEKAEESGDAVKKQEAKDFMLLYDSLQLAHKCILNSFYGYVMRKGARWHSMKMAGIVTYTGSNLIREAREFCEMVGLPIELDTDGIWCMLPKSFPDTFKFKLKGGKEIKMPYSNCVLNYRVHEKYTNHQYQDKNPTTGVWETRSENSIFFEIDGPYKCMVLPASTEEDKMLKKRYAVYNFDGSLAELKGFEIKRRGELKAIQVFQEEVFPAFLGGTTKQEVWDNVGQLANRWLDVIESKGRSMTDDEVIYLISENKSMSKSVEASGNYKSVQITCARRLAQFLEIDSMLKDAGVACHMLIAKKPENASTTDRAIPVKIFNAEFEVKKQWLRTWCEDQTMNDFDMRSVIDWDYYKERLCSVFLKLITIPANFQKFANPCPRVQVPAWLKKRVAEQNDRFQQRSLGMYLKKTAPGGNDVDGAKRKLCDLEDLVGPGPGGVASKAAEGPELPIVEFGHGPKKWLQAQRLRWVAEKSKVATPARGGAGARSSLFDGAAAWATISSEALHSTWHIVSVEPVQAPKNSATLRMGDAVLVQLDDDESMGVSFSANGTAAEPAAPIRGTLAGFIGGLMRVTLEDGGERLVDRGSVTPYKEEGLFTVWAATEPGLSLHRFEVVTKRKVVLALESEFSPEDARTPVRPSELVKGMRVWPREQSATRVGPGTVRSAAPEVGLCAVTWANEHTEVIMSDELERQCGSVAKVLRDPPRNLRHPCLLELELGEAEFQQQRGEGALGDRDSAWPKVEAIYEAEQPLEFDLITRLGPTVKLAAPEAIEEARGGSRFRFEPNDLMSVAGGDLRYLPGFSPLRNIYLHLCFDRTRPSWCFCGIVAPALSEVWVAFGGIDSAEGDGLRPELEQLLSEQLSAVRSGTAEAAGGLPSAVRAEVTFVGGRSFGLVQWIEQKLQELRRLDGVSVCVLCSQLSAAELRGLTPSFWLEPKQLRHLTALREIPLCRAPFAESDSHFPAMDWPRWISRRFAAKVPQLFGWWRERLSICRSAGLPVCSAPDVLAATVPAALDALFSRQLQRDSQLRWASSTCRPDLGEVSLMLVDAQEDSLRTIDWVLQGKALTAGRGGGQMNHAGVYRSVCLEVNLRTKLCICALQHARYLSDMEGGELSKRMIRKVTGAGEFMRNVDHTSEASVTSLESLVNMVQSIAEVRDAKMKEIASLRQRWAAQGAGADIAGIAPDDDASFVAVMKDAGVENSTLVARLEELRLDYDAQNKLLDGLYGWLASPTSLFYDGALLRKVHQYMDRVLQLLVNVLKRNGCQVIHASYTRIFFATGKLRVVPDVQHFWDSLCENVKSVKALEPLALNDVSCLSELYYGVFWMDPANWSGVPIDPDTGAVLWKAHSCWKVADFLPPAVRPSLTLYIGELLVGPQQELERRYVQSTLSGDQGREDVADAAGGDGAAMDVDGEEAGGEDAGEEDAEEADVAAKPAVPAAKDSNGGAASAAGADAGGGDGSSKTAEVLDDLRGFIKGEFFEQLRLRVLRFITDLQAQQAREIPNGLGAKDQLPRLAKPDLDDRDDSESDDDEDEDGPGARERQAVKQRRLVQQKWSFPEIPGRIQKPGGVDFEFMRALVLVFQLEDCISDQVMALRDRICQKLKVSTFAISRTTESTCFPLILRDVVCPRCCMASHVDVTSHPSRAPGLWVCVHCQGTYDKDVMQAQLVALLNEVVQAWQAQEVICKKCKRLRTTKLLTVCECFGRFQLRYDTEDFKLGLRMLRSLVVPHDLPWLGQMLTMYESAL